MFFNRDFGLHAFTKGPSLHPTLPRAPPAPGLSYTSEPGTRTTRKKNASNKFLKATDNYSKNIRRLAVCRFVVAELRQWLHRKPEQLDLRADCGTWLIDLDAKKAEKLVTWVAEAGHGDRYDEKGKKKIDKSITDATSRLRRCVDAIMTRDGKLRGSDALDIKNALANIKK
ncbi:hypothetical protein AC579_9270 [Pseudocercospora musae]|uniref:Uncharacterized protein n=1 Tax=Pseudocercospora musae TaxID=113226 RepID=A0A139IHU8_9PEZI|nr:hypothetical protein AC579_9270 [Pseudocercospora musae]